MVTGERKDVMMNQLKAVRGTQSMATINNIHCIKSGRSTKQLLDIGERWNKYVKQYLK